MSLPAATSTCTVDEQFPGDILARKYATGFALLEWRDGRVRARTGFQAKADDIFWLGCLSKTITATAVMQLVDRGEVALDDRIDRFVPKLNRAIGATTVRQLLSHSGGLPRNVPGWTSFFDREWLSESLNAVTRRLDVAPGPTVGQRSYSSAGYVLLGRMIERVDGGEFGAVIARQIFAPLGMRDSFCINAIPSSHVARIAPAPFVPDGQPIRNSMPFAGFFSTVDDLARFMRVFIEPDACRRLMRQQTVDRMFDEEARGQAVHQALAWSLCFRETRACGCWHTSSNGSILVGDRTTGAAVVILGQGVIESDLVPLRAVQWRYLERVMRVSATPRCAVPVGV
jgi:CubicO group peptidase (beta-lactamase class C family)